MSNSGSNNIAVFIVDAFTERPFSGNQAAVCPLDGWLDDALLQQIAAEHNLSETAFLVAKDGDYAIRWFTPRLEVDLCGHATLAAAHVVFERLAPALDRVVFQSKSGPLAVERRGERIAMDFPALPPLACDLPASLAEALGAAPVNLLAAKYLMAVFDDPAAVAALRPDMRGLAQFPYLGVIATAPGNDCDFVSRFFAPRAGIDEDPVTGSAHCTLAPYWAGRLRKRDLFARQISARGGEIWCSISGDRVELAGRARTFSAGTIFLPSGNG